VSLTLEFFVANAEQLHQTILDIEDEEETLNSMWPSTKRADFSLNLEPNDLELLSEEAAKMINKAVIHLRDSFDEMISYEVGAGVCLLNAGWVAQFAAIPISSAHDLTAHWFNAMSQFHGAPIQITSEAKASVSSLISICKQAQEDTKSIIYFWLG
jgi:hypothetical protein